MTAGTDNTTKIKELQEIVEGEVFVKKEILTKFSHDFSMYEIRPLAVVEPHDVEDLRNIILFAAAKGLHITPRGGGSGTTGAALGREIIVALPRSAFWTRVKDFHTGNTDAYISVQAGMLHNDLQHYLQQRGYFLPADVSSARISQIGGNVATKASGPHALKYGAIDRFIENIEFLSAQGEVINTADKSSIPGRILDPLQVLSRRIVNDNDMRTALEAKRFTKTSSGYNLFAFLGGYEEGKLLARLLAGSNGTLGFITQVTLRAKSFESARATMLLYFSTLTEACRAVCALRDLGVAAIEIISKETAALINKKRNKKRSAGKILDKEHHMVFVEFSGSDRSTLIREVKRILRHGGYALSREPVVATDEAEVERLWEFRRQILPCISNLGPSLKALAVVNDVGVDSCLLADFIGDLLEIFKKHAVEPIVYGHAGSGNLHLRPVFDMTKADLPQRINKLADDVYDIVFRYNGTVSGEHGIGRLKAPYLKQEWGDKLYDAMKEVKLIFDPDGIFNPGVMFSDRCISDNMRPDLLAGLKE